jgi:hypothetical protein
MVRVNAEVVDILRYIWSADGTSQVMLATWRAFRASEAHFRSSLPTTGASRLAKKTAPELLMLLHAAAGVDQGITECAPAEISRVAKAALYYNILLVRVLGAAWRGPVSPEEAIRSTVGKISALACTYAIGPLVASEIRRRGAQHAIGFNAALLELMRQAGAFSTLLVPDEEAVLRTLTRSALRLGRRLGLQHREDIEGLSSQAAITIAKECGDTDPLQLVARALAGELDHAGRAIAFDALDAARPARRWREIELHFEALEEVPDRATLPHARAAADFARELHRKAAAGDPRLARYLEAAADGADRKTVAARLGVSMAYVDKCRARLKKLAATLSA